MPEKEQEFPFCRDKRLSPSRCWSSPARACWSSGRWPPRTTRPSSSSSGPTSTPTSPAPPASTSVPWAIGPFIFLVSKRRIGCRCVFQYSGAGGRPATACLELQTSLCSLMCLQGRFFLLKTSFKTFRSIDLKITKNLVRLLLYEESFETHPKLLDAKASLCSTPVSESVSQLVS